MEEDERKKNKEGQEDGVENMRESETKKRMERNDKEEEEDMRR